MSNPPHASLPAIAPETDTASDRRHDPRYATDVRAFVLLVHSRILSPARILDISIGGCRVRSEKRFSMGIFVRLELEFVLRGLPFRLGGVSQHIVDEHTFGIRFLDLSPRRKALLAELIAEVALAEAREKAAAAEAI